MTGFLFSRTWTKVRLSQMPMTRTIAGSAGQAAATEAPMMLRLRSELTAAMKARDKIRLDVLRTTLGDFKNRELRGEAFNKDEKIRKYLTSRAKAQRTAALQFEGQDRKDLSDKELAQVAILEGYANEIAIASEQDIRDAIDKAVEEQNSKELTVNIGSIVKYLRSKDGPLEGMTMDYDQAIEIMKEKGIPGAVAKNK